MLSAKIKLFSFVLKRDFNATLKTSGPASPAVIQTKLRHA